MSNLHHTRTDVQSVQNISFQRIKTTHRAQTTMESKLSLLDCPPEIISHIFSHVNNGDLMELRLVNKQISASATRPFGLAYFTERNHVISEHSIQVLLDITEHPVFGPYVKTVVLNGVFSLGISTDTNIPEAYNRWNAHAEGYLTDYSDEDDDELEMIGGHERFIISAKFAEMMQRVFKTIEEHGNRVIIGVRDSGKGPKASFGWRHLIRRSGPMFTYDLAEALERTLLAAERAECSLYGVKCHIWQRPESHWHGLQRSITALAKLFGQESSPFFISFVRTRPSDKSRLLYDRARHCLKVTAFTIQGRRFKPRTLSHGFSYSSMVPAHISRLQLDACALFDTDNMRKMLDSHKSTLRSISIRKSV